MTTYTHKDIRLGTDDFTKLLLESQVFVDKSLFVQAFLEDSGKVALITRPRRWGKSLNMDMLKRFLAMAVDKHGVQVPLNQSLNRKLFLGGTASVDAEKTKQLPPLKIAQEQHIIARYQGKFPVISLGLKGIKGDSYTQIKGPK